MSGTMFCTLVTSATSHPVPVAVGAHPEVIEATLKWMTKLVECHRRGKMDCGKGSDLCSAVQAKRDRVCLHVQIFNIKV